MKQSIFVIIQQLFLDPHKYLYKLDNRGYKRTNCSDLQLNMYMAGLSGLQILSLVYTTAKNVQKKINEHIHIGRLISCHENIKEALQYRILPDAMSRQPCLTNHRSRGKVQHVCS